MQLSEIDLEKRQMILRDFKNGLTRAQAKNNIVEKFGNCVGYGVRTCDRWFTKFNQGDFDLTKKPTDKSLKQPRDYNTKKIERPTRTVKVDEVKFKQQEITPPATMNIEKNTTVQKLMKSKPELTISKVPANGATVVKKPPLQSNIITKRLITSPKPTPVSTTKVKKQAIAAKVESPNLRPRRPRSQGIEIQLPVSAAKRMNPQTLTENHSIGEESNAPNKTEIIKSTVTENPAPKELTVQFQNLIPEIAKNTVRKPPNKSVNKRHTLPYQKPQNSVRKITNGAHVESINPEKNKTTEQTHMAESPNKRGTVPPQASPLNNQKGIIYLNPQEIFRQSFGGFEKSLTRPSPYAKSGQAIQNISKSLPKPRPALQPPPQPVIQDSVILCDSDDSVEEIVFPQNISLPTPKIKANATYTTYYDLESGELINLNPEEPNLPKPQNETATPIQVIEID